jgi:hypothetical protein
MDGAAKGKLADTQIDGEPHSSGAEAPRPALSPRASCMSCRRRPCRALLRSPVPHQRQPPLHAFKLRAIPQRRYVLMSSPLAH